MKVTFRATQDERDAPISWYLFADGTGELRRDDLAPRSSKPIVSMTVYLHGVVMVGGEMSRFDKENRRRR